VDLPVVHGHELSGLDHIDVDPELGEVGVGTFKSQTAERPSTWNQPAAWALSTYQPFPLGTSPRSVGSNPASGTIRGVCRTDARLRNLRRAVIVPPPGCI